MSLNAISQSVGQSQRKLVGAAPRSARHHRNPVCQ